MPAKKATKAKSANASANLYDGLFEVLFDCAGADKCVHARFYAEPPDPDDDCSCHRDGTCLNSTSRKAALELIRDGVANELKVFEDEY